MERQELQRYFARDLKWGWGHQARLVFDFLNDAARFAAGGVVLDAGAGHQRYKPFFRDCVYVAQEHPIAGHQNKNLTEYDILADVKRIPLRDQCVDLVLSTSSLEHMEFPDAFFCDAARVLRPGGALYIHVPFLLAEHEIPFDFQRPTRYGLHRYYAHSGFQNVAVRPASSGIENAVYLLLMAIKEDGRRLGLLGKAFAGAAYLTAISLGRLTTAVLDRGRFDDTIMPVGWLATGYTPGTRTPPQRYASSQEFIMANALCGADTRLDNGRIVSLQPG